MFPIITMSLNVSVAKDSVMLQILNTVLEKTAHHYACIAPVHTVPMIADIRKIQVSTNVRIVARV